MGEGMNHNFIMKEEEKIKSLELKLSILFVIFLALVAMFLV